MIKQIRIGDIHICLTYQFEDYFQDTLKQYEEEYPSENSHKLRVSVKELLAANKQGKVFNYKNRIKYSDDLGEEIVTYFPDGSIKHIIRYSNDFKEIEIELNQIISDRLAEYEYVLSGMMFFEIALRNKYLPIHASAISVDKRVILLSGPSKSGKSTQTKYFLEVEAKAEIINEDKPLIKVEEDKVYILGTPWSGKNVINKNVKLPLKGIFFLEKSKFSAIEEINDNEKLKILLKNIHRPGDEVNIDNMIDVLAHVIERVEIYRYNCENNLNSAKALKSFLEDR
jgi:hypothetical protein